MRILCLKCEAVVEGNAEPEDLIKEHCIEYHLEDFLIEFENEFVEWAKVECFNWKEECS